MASGIRLAQTETTEAKKTIQVPLMEVGLRLDSDGKETRNEGERAQGKRAEGTRQEEFKSYVGQR